MGTADVERTIRNRNDPSWGARYGTDESGPWAEVPWNGIVVRHDPTDVDADDDPVEALVMFLSSWGFLDPCAVAELRAYLDTPSCWRSNRPPRRVRRVLALIEHLRSGAGG